MRYYITDYMEHYRKQQPDSPKYLHDMLHKAQAL
jgi:hypothetical protein